MSDTYQPVFDAVRTSLRNTDIGQAVSDAVVASGLSHCIGQIQTNFSIAIGDVQEAMVRPSVLFRPSVYLDGNQWCALYGPNIQEGVCGFGDSPELAMSDFDKYWKRGEQ